MSTFRATETELIELLSRFIKERDDDTPFRLEEQQAELKRRKCSAPALGELIANTDFPFLIETLLLSDALFAEEFPGVRLSADERKRLAHDLEAHCEGCARCGLFVFVDGPADAGLPLKVIRP